MIFINYNRNHLNEFFYQTQTDSVFENKLMVTKGEREEGCGSQCVVNKPISITITWVLVRNADVWVPLQPTKSETLGWAQKALHVIQILESKDYSSQLLYGQWAKDSFHVFKELQQPPSPPSTSKTKAKNTI